MPRIQIPGPESRRAVWCDFFENEAIAREFGGKWFCVQCGSTEHAVL